MSQEPTDWERRRQDALREATEAMRAANAAQKHLTRLDRELAQLQADRDYLAGKIEGASDTYQRQPLEAGMRQVEEALGERDHVRVQIEAELLTSQQRQAAAAQELDALQQALTNPEGAA